MSLDWIEQHEVYIYGRVGAVGELWVVGFCGDAVRLSVYYLCIFNFNLFGKFSTLSRLS